MKNTKIKKEQNSLKKTTFYKLLISTGFILLATLLHPTHKSGLKKVYFETGEIAPYDVISPVTFQIPKKKEDIEKEKQIARSRVKPYIVKVEESFKNIEKIEIKNSLSKNEEKKLLSNLRKLQKELSEKIIIMDKNVLKKYGDKAIVIENGTQRLVDIQGLMDTLDVKNFVNKRSKTLYPGNNHLQSIFYEAFFATFKPNYRFNFELTEKKQKEVELSVIPFKGIVLEGEKIIGAHEKVTPEIEEKLFVLNQLIYKGYGAKDVILRKFYIFVVFALIFLIFYYITRFHFRKIYENIQLITVHFINLSLILIFSYILIQLKLPYYFIPLPFLSIISGVVSSPLFGIILTFMGAVYLAIYFDFMFIPFLFFILIGGVGVVLIKFLKRRFYLYFSGIIIFLCGTALVLFFSYLFELKYRIPQVLLGNLLSGIISISLLSLMLVFYERFFGITTDFILMELLNINHPLLLELSRKALGTFAHANLIANLAESAARAVGANPLLVRVGAYFHDIGKMANPEYYAENQKGVNPHDKLSPQISALILKTHIKYGVELAQKHRLPDSVVDMIKTHHGTTLMVPFYEKAKMANPNVNEEDFRYPGPKPRTKEEAVLMLADTVEATVRSIESPNPLRVREVVEAMIKRRFLDGQFDECEITRKDLDKIEEAFIPILISYFHERPEYPRSGS